MSKTCFDGTSCLAKNLDVSVVPSFGLWLGLLARSLPRERAVTIDLPSSEVVGTATLAVEVVVEQSRHARARLASSGRVMGLRHIVNGIAVATGRSIVALGREHVDEVEEALVAVRALRVRSTAVGVVVTGVEGGAKVGNLLALVVLPDSVVAARDEGGGVVLLVGLVVAETFGVVVPGGAVDVRSLGTSVAQPTVAVRVGGPEGDFDAVCGANGSQGGVALDELGTHGVSCDDDFVHLRESVLVGEVVDDFVEDVERGDVGVCFRVDVIASVSPVVVVPHKSV